MNQIGSRHKLLQKYVFFVFFMNNVVYKHEEKYIIATYACL